MSNKHLVTSHKYMRHQSFWSSGQSLVEVTVASVALIFGLVAVVSGLILSLRNSAVANNQTKATQDAQEVIEVFRKFQRQLGWETFYNVLRADGTNYTYCVLDMPTDVASFQTLPVGSCTQGANSTDFVRNVDILVRSTTEIQVTVTVSWRDGTTNRIAGARNIFRSYR